MVANLHDDQGRVAPPSFSLRPSMEAVLDSVLSNASQADIVASVEALLTGMEGNSTIQSLADPQRAAASADFYITYMNQHLFGPLGIEPRDCKPVSDPYFAVLSYPLTAGSTPGFGFYDETLDCGPGGWKLSLDDLFAVTSDLATGNVLLTKAQKIEMYANCLGWDCSDPLQSA